MFTFCTICYPLLIAHLFAFEKVFGKKSIFILSQHQIYIGIVLLLIADRSIHLYSKEYDSGKKQILRTNTLYASRRDRPPWCELIRLEYIWLQRCVLVHSCVCLFQCVSVCMVLWTTIILIYLHCGCNHFFKSLLFFSEKFWNF